MIARASASTTQPAASAAKTAVSRKGTARMLTEQPETFWTLLHNAAHWEFEIFLMILFDLIIGGLAWPFVKKHWKHHVEHDRMEGHK
jgi:hypothetical protein